jgi:peptidoglycan/xylan/chitin deacetylase (PgdA/CDA1 family)
VTKSPLNAAARGAEARRSIRSNKGNGGADRALKVVFLKGCRAIGLFRVARQITRRRLRILCYHGFSIGDQHEFAPLVFMRKEVFQRRMEILRRLGFPVVALREGIALLKNNSVDRAQVSITIDDGWKTTLTHAAPILREAGYPACVYVTTYYSERNVSVFNVVIWYMLWRTEREEVQLRGIHPEVDGPYDLRTDREAVGLRWISAIERHFDYWERENLLPIIAEALGLDGTTVLQDKRFSLMSREDVQALSIQPNIDVQLHTHRHRLPKESRELVSHEIEDNRRVLEAWTGKPCTHFCYPSGIYDGNHPEWLATLGIESATTCDAGMNDVSVSPLLLRRYLDRDDWSDVEFEAAVSGFKEILNGLRRMVGGKGENSPDAMPHEAT